MDVLHVSALVAAAVWFAACGACDEQRAVPFKRDEAAATPAVAPLATPDAAAGAPPATAGAFTPRDGTSHGENTRRVALEGGAIEIAEGSIRAALDVDLDGDQDLDALLVIVDGTGATALSFAERDERGYAAPRRIDALALERPTCALESAALRQFAPRFVAVRGEARCATSLPASTAAAPIGAAKPPTPSASVPPTAPTNAPPGAPPPSAIAQHLWIATVEALPRVVEHVGWDGEGRAEPGAVVVQDVAPAGTDLDADGHDDVEVTVALRRTLDPEPATFALRLFDRPAGLARDPSEPETALRKLADAARDALKRDPARALAAAERALAFHAALCRESDRSVLRFDDAAGLACGKSRAAGRAAAVRVAALARTGAVLAAVAGYSALGADAYDVPGVDRDRLKAALGAVSEKTYAWRAGPAVETPSGPAVRLPAIGFLDEDMLLLRGAVPRTYSLRDGTETPTGAAGDLLVADPEQRFAVVGIARSCEGYRLRIVRVEQIVAGVVEGASASEPLVLAAPPPPGARCPGQLSPALRKDTGGWRVLGWGRAGIMLVRNGELWRLPIDAAANAVTPVTPVARDDGSIAAHRDADGIEPRLALVTDLGVAVVDTTNASAKLVPFAGSELEKSPPSADADAAVSFYGRSVAVVHAGRVYFATEHAAPPAPPAPGTAQAPPASAPGTAQAPPAP